MATLLIFDFSGLHGAYDAALVAGDVAAAPEVPAVGRGGWAFDDTDEEAVLTNEVEMPSQYTGSGLTGKVHGYFKTETTVTSEAVMDVFVEAKTPGSDTLDMEAAASWDTANSMEIDPGGTAGDPVVGSTTLTNADSVAVGDSVRFGLRRDCDATADIASGDFVVTSLVIEDDG